RIAQKHAQAPPSSAFPVDCPDRAEELRIDWGVPKYATADSKAPDLLQVSVGDRCAFQHEAVGDVLIPSIAEFNHNVGELLGQAGVEEQRGEEIMEVLQLMPLAESHQREPRHCIDKKFSSVAWLQIASGVARLFRDCSSRSRGGQSGKCGHHSPDEN